ncbi:hypothetical protein [Oceanisphaera sp. KMM 10153]|uniref:hypothetical protein n=1 Tax=Oceanisphaera submarina TaxID=3390193 RepID=UPI003974C9D3
MNSIFENMPSDLSGEHFLDLLKTPNVRIARIVSRGRSSAGAGWFDQDEWVMVPEGTGTGVVKPR